jgi:hypothetical protein
MRRKIDNLFWPVILLLSAMIYVQSSWWCWWFGGSYGMRAYVELAGILAFPMAASLEKIFVIDRKWLSGGLITIFTFLIFLQQFQTYQYTKGFIHYNGMNKYTYWHSFMRLGWHPQYWNSLTLPDYDLARKGIYVFYRSGDNHDDLMALGKDKGTEVLEQRVRADKKLYREVERYARRTNTPVGTATAEVAEQMYKSMTNL